MLSVDNFNKNWQIVPLGQVVNFLDNLRKPITASDRTEGEYPYYGANGIQGTIDKYIFEEPLLLLAEDGGHFGNPDKDIAYIAEGKYWVNNHAHVLKPKDNLDLRFLFRVLQRYDVSRYIKGATRAKLTKGDASQIPIPLPPLEEQKRIAAILDKADAIRRKRQQAIKLADEFLRAVFLDMFGDPVTNPKDWPVKPLGEVVENKDGKRIPIKASDRSDITGEYPYYGASGIIDFVNNYIFDSPNLLIGEDGANLLTRSTPIAFIADGKYWVNNHAHVLGQKELPLEYIMFSINLRSLEPYISGSAQPKLNQANLNKIPIQIPPINQIKHFLDIYEKHLKLSTFFRQMNVEQLSQALNHKAFIGIL